MRKLLYLFILVIAVSQSACAGDVITHDAKKLPAAARKFISSYFPNTHVSHIKIESELFRTVKYEVLLTDRTEIDFDHEGYWLEVDCNDTSVPVELIPDYVSRYLKNTFPDAYVVKIERKHREMEVDLNNDWSITFSAAGEVIEVDN